MRAVFPIFPRRVKTSTFRSTEKKLSVVSNSHPPRWRFVGGSFDEAASPRLGAGGCPRDSSPGRMSVADGSASTAPKTRLIITHMTLENFKSYAGIQQIGPFHKVSARGRRAMHVHSSIASAGIGHFCSERRGVWGPWGRSERIYRAGQVALCIGHGMPLFESLRSAAKRAVCACASVCCSCTPPFVIAFRGLEISGLRVGRARERLIDRACLQRFSSVVGPNGSGKSNVIDAMLFVFGKRAKQLRLNKV